MNLNLISMIDIIFQLIIFFVLTAQISTIEVPPEIQLAQPPASAATIITPDQDHRVIINLMPDETDRSKVDHLAIGYTTFDVSTAGLARLADDLRRTHDQDPSMKINLRADRAAAYADVYPVLQAAIKSGTGNIDLIVGLPEPPHASPPVANADVPTRR